MHAPVHPFFTDENPHGNVRFNFRGAAPNDLAAFAAGFHEAGRVLVRKLASSPGYADYEGYPVLFLYRHALELYLKAIVYRGARYAGLFDERALSTERFYRSHDLVRLLAATREAFRCAGWAGEPDLDNLKSWDDFSALIRTIHGLDPGSYAFRYPMDPHGDPSMPPHLLLNVIAFGRNMDPVLDLLSGAGTGLEDRWDTAAEACYFLQEIAREWRDEP